MTVLNYQGIAPLGVIYAFLMFSPPGPGLLAISNNQGHPTTIFEKYLFGRRFEI